MNEKWIGKEDDTSGSYRTTICEELSKRHGGYINAIPLYRFEDRFDTKYNITDEDVINNIEELLAKGEDELSKLYDYLYTLVIQEFGVLEYLQNIEHKIAKERDAGYRKGKEHVQRDMRKLLGFNG